MGILEQLGYNGPVAKFIGSNRNTLGNLGAGIASGRNFGEGVALGSRYALQGRQLDDQYAAMEKAKADEAAALERAIANMRKYNPQVADMVAAGMPAEAGWNSIMQGMGAEGDPFTLGPGQTRFGPNGEVIATGGEETPTPTSDMQEYLYAVSQGYQGSFTDYQTEMRRAGATNIDFNANQGAAAGYADRMIAADQVLNDPTLTMAMTDLVEQGKSNVPIAGNFLVSKEYQMAEQAQRDFVNAVLRRESGAVISPSEFENAKRQYFPQPGDSKEVIEQKRRNRQIAIQGVSRAAGPNYGSAPASTPGVVDWTTYFGGQ